jgi:hypothetical protein
VDESIYQESHHRRPCSRKRVVPTVWQMHHLQPLQRVARAACVSHGSTAVVRQRAAGAAGASSCAANAALARLKYASSSRLSRPSAPSTPAHTSSLFVPPLPSFFPQIRHITSVVLSAAAACPIFDLRSMRAHYLQPPAPLAFTLSPRALEFASLQPWCRDNTQRAQLLCCSCPLSTLAFRLSRAVNRYERQRDFERSATARIMRRCFGVFAWRRWIERAL